MSQEMLQVIVMKTCTMFGLASGRVAISLHCWWSRVCKLVHVTVLLVKVAVEAFDAVPLEECAVLVWRSPTIAATST